MRTNDGAPRNLILDREEKILKKHPPELQESDQDATKYIQKLIDIRGRANLSRNSLFNHLFIDLELFENSAAALRGSWQRSHFS